MEYIPSTPMDDKHLGQFGENTARTLHPAGRMGGEAVGRNILARLAVIRRVRDRLSTGEAPSGGAEWLLDNWYLAQREGQGAAAAFRRARALRYVVRQGRQPVVLELSRAFLHAAGGETGQARMSLFLSRAQRALPLSEEELFLWAPALQCALVERLSELCLSLERQGDGDALRAGMSAVFTALRALSEEDLTGLLESASLVEAALRRDPAGIYPHMDEESRARYRRKVCRLARKEGRPERDTAERLLHAAARSTGADRHVGAHLFPEKHARLAPALYIGALVLITAFLSLLAGFALDRLWAAALLALPLSDIVKNVIDFAVVRLVRPRHIFRMALEGGIPEEGRTLCVVAALLTSAESGPALAGLLERYRLANRDAGTGLRLGLLCDLPDRDRPMGPAEEAWLAAARTAVGRLNETYGGGFYLFFRAPVFHAPDQRYMGWERKRGALLELSRLLRGRQTGLRVEEGEPGWLRGVRYVITLDSDTALCVGAARELAGAMLHPLNRPVVDPRRRVVARGHGLLQPRIAVDLESANKSHFTRIFAGQGGVDPYGCAASDVYHDLFGEATFTGKGIFDVDAFLTCLDHRLPENAVLSHDLLEGSYLRAGLIGDVELTDGYPSQITAYFTRLHRWVRGDWQASPWLGRSVRRARGEREQNPLSAIHRWKIFDNLRRSLSPVSLFISLALGMCLSGPAFALSAGIAILSAWSSLLLTGADLLFRRGGGLGERYHSTIIAGFGGALLQTLLQLLLLPFHAWTCAGAACTALWRMAVTRRGLLAWTTAAEAERRTKNGLSAYYRKLWPLAAAGLACALLSPLPVGAAAGLVWLAGPGFAWSLSRPIRQSRAVPEGERPFLLHHASLIWDYFARYLRPEDHYLPPDNLQEQPAVGLARRTSPTNIGLSLLCCVAAVDLDLTARSRAAGLIGRILSTLEGLEKWRGHLYNWYDTASAAPLEPRYVSTVDSGNLCGCLIALSAALEGWGESGLARRARALSDAMDFSPLYDRDRRLFSIGFDCARGELTRGWYDLMASEARQTSYLAVARGEVPPRHWRRLSRALVGQDHYRGMASWTGTMFEYFMPHLLLPAYQNSMLYESLHFCLHAQKERVRGTRAPWGISESAYYAFDAAMNYQYKAHGVQRLGLKRGLDQELVVSPYSTFLALPLSPRSATRNLRRLEALGLGGPFGLYEAADFTPARTAGTAPFEPVNSYMAHHLGMSLVAIDNALREGVMQERFLADPSMSAYRELLQERVPVGAQVMRSPGREVPEKPRTAGTEPFLRRGEGWDPADPACHLLTSGAWRVLCTDAGANQSHMGKSALTRSQWGRPFRGAGVSFFLRTEGELLPLTPAPLYREGPVYRWAFWGGGARWTAEKGEVSTQVRLQVPNRENGEVWTVTVRGRGRAELICYLEPVLSPLEDYEAHPAFSKLSLESRSAGDGVLFTRRPRRLGESRPSLAVMWDGLASGFDTSREHALGRGGLQGLEGALERAAAGTEGAVLDPCLLARFPLELRGGEGARLRLTLSAADSPDQAVRAALRLLSLRGEDHTCLPDRERIRLKLTGGELQRAYQLLARLRFPDRPAVRRGSPEQAELWPLGVSGDLPILAYVVRGPEDLETARTLTRLHQFLSKCGFSFDLALPLEEGAGYRRPLRDALAAGLRSEGWDHRLEARGGVFLPELGAAGPLLRHALVLESGGGLPPRRLPPPPGPPPLPFRLQPGLPPFSYLEDGAFRFETGPRLPPLGWSTLLVNRRFGWRTDETGSGHLWSGNARENPLTAWENDPLAVTGPEGLWMCAGEDRCSWFAAPDGLSCAVTYGFGWASWEKALGRHTLRCTAFVPPEEEARYLLLEAEGLSGSVVWTLDGAEAGRWPLSGRLCLRTVPAPGEPRPATAPCPDWERAEALLSETRRWWERRVCALRVETPEPAMDRYLNGWGLYQVLACRLFGRTSLYQNGGAYGFRDQLQDVCALLSAAPELAREQILRACAHQYREGDVMHWWHPAPEGGVEKGVRTRISDDLLWLPYALCEYLEKTGDEDILSCPVPFLASPPLSDGERERYEEASPAGAPDTVLAHACRAADRVLSRGFGPHGLARMGSGDWNDGMDLVGAGGTGESVWLTWFLSLTLSRLAPLCPGEERRRYTGAAADCAAAANAAWDGGWFLRGWYDDGAPLGSAGSPSCRIDSIAQSFAALCPLGDPDRAAQGVRAALEQLFDRENRVVRLFTPPFDGGDRDPGYLAGYLPGVRENGGQYTHGAVWLALSCLRLGMADEGAELLRSLLPADHPPEVYQGEPYVLSADVYANPQHVGRGGWSWYTGAAGWFYRTAVEELLGLRLQAGRLFLSPRLPRSWGGFTAVWRLPKGVLRIRVERAGRPGLFLDGAPHSGGVDLEGLTGEHQLLFSF